MLPRNAAPVSSMAAGRLACLIGLMFSLPASALLDPLFHDAAAGSQVWVLVTVDDSRKEGDHVNIQIPLEWAKKSEWIASCGDSSSEDKQGINGQELYQTYRGLPQGEERLVRRIRCEQSDVTVRVASREASRGRHASRLVVRVRDAGEDRDQDVDISLSLDALDALRHFFEGDWLRIEPAEDKSDLVRDLPGNMGLLKGLPPFELVHVKGEDGSVVVRTE